jgi:HEAT repeat protein
MLRQPQPSVDEDRGRALDAIACLGPVGKAALPDILPLVTNQSYQLKIRAFFAVKSIGPETEFVKPVLPILFQALGDPEWTTRLAAINTLAALHPRPPEVAPTFIRFLDDPSEMVREEAMRWLVAQTNPVVIPMLDKQLHDQDGYVLTKAATQIGAFGPAAAGSEARLRELLNDPSSTVRQAATNALAAIRGQPLARAATDEKADVTFDMARVPLQMFLDFYENLAGKKVMMEAAPKLGQMLRVTTARPLTKSAALQLLEEVLKEQAGLVIVHGPDGSLTAVSNRPVGPY